jgi:hypothetical protein
VILLFLNGGHAQMETWDPKPDGPSPARGEFAAIATTVPGISIGELLPRSAQVMNKVALVRSLSHGHPDHVVASLPALTGHPHPPTDDGRPDFPPAPTDFPPVGAVLDRLRPSQRLPTWVQVGPTMRRNNGTLLHGQSPGFLGGRHAPLVIDQDLSGGVMRVEAFAPDPALPLLRLSERRNLLRQVDDQRTALEQAAGARELDRFQERALDLLTDHKTAEAFDLSDEPAAVRAAYGRNTFGQGCLLARRLAEAGVPMINVHYCRTPVGSWDTHSDHFRQMKHSLCPTFDQAFSSLVDDLDRRGMLAETLVVATAEFGRTPKVNRAGGRDHWPWVYSIALAGAGICGGQVVGSSDNLAAYPVSRPHDPKDLFATIYHLLGVAPETTLTDPLGQPHRLVIGKVIAELLA